MDEAAEVDQARAMSSAAPVQAVFSRLGRTIGHLVGGQGYHDRLRTATFAREVLERSGELKRDWNRQVERAAEEGVHVIYTDGYDRLHEELDTVSKNMLLDRGVKSEISAVLAQLGKVVSNRNYFDSCREFMAGRMNRREALEAKAAERGVAVPDHGDYDTWRGRDRTLRWVVARNSWTTRAVTASTSITSRSEKRASAQRSRGCANVLEDDDLYLAATLAGQREGESLRMREERIARLLDDPEKLRELRQQRAERKAGKQQSKGRYWSMRI